MGNNPTKRRVTPPEVFQEKCTGCGVCLQVCPSFVLELLDGKVRVARGEWCIGCGQCGAACPKEAVVHNATALPTDAQAGIHSTVSPEILLRLLRERRSVRTYKKDPIPEGSLKQILEAGRFAPTGTNSQNVCYLVLTSPNEIEHLRGLVIQFYQRIFSRIRHPAGAFLFSLFAGRKTAAYLRGMLPKANHAAGQIKEGKDPLFYHASAIMIAHAESWDTCSAFNCSVALYHCSLMAHTMGIGCCFNGFLMSAANHDRRTKTFLGISRNHHCFAAMTLGYQDVRYRRLVKRNPPNVVWR